MSEDNRIRIHELLWVFSCDATTDPDKITEEIIQLATMCEPKIKDESINNELLEALKMAESVLSENFASIRKANSNDLSAMKEISRFETDFSQEAYNAKTESIRHEHIELQNLITKLREVITKYNNPNV